MPPAKEKHGAGDKVAHAVAAKDAHKGAQVADRAHGKKSKGNIQVADASQEKATQEKASNEKAAPAKASADKPKPAAANKPTHATDGTKDAKKESKKDSKPVTAQLAAARHKHAHKNEKVAQN
jgi:hypothetical protein